jgi:hypothetical protein
VNPVGTTQAKGELQLAVLRGGSQIVDPVDLAVARRRELIHPLAVPVDDVDLRALIAEAMPHRSQARHVQAWHARNLPNIWRGARRLVAARALGLPHMFGALWLHKIDGATGEVTDYGLASLRVVTDVGCQKIVAAMNTSDAATAIAFKFHGLGTGTTAEASTDTALVTELTTEYAVNSTRATGTQTTGATTKVYRTVATNTLDSGTPAITEHGVFSAASAGSLLDRSKFSAITLNGAGGDGLQSTYDFTMVSGG